MNKKILEKLIELIMESANPKKYEVAYAAGSTIIQEGLRILGIDASDILGFAKPENEIRIRKLRGSQAWFNTMYASGWRYVAKFEYEGLPHNGLFIMQRELPNLTLKAIKEELDVLIRSQDEGSRYIHVPNPEILRGGPELINSDVESVVPQLYKDEAIGEVYKAKKGLAKKKITLTEKGREAKEVIDQMIKEGQILPTAVREPREGFESDVNDFMLDAQKEMKTDAQLFFEETGKKAIWKGKETKAFKTWKEGLDNAN